MVSRDMHASSSVAERSFVAMLLRTRTLFGYAVNHNHPPTPPPFFVSVDSARVRRMDLASVDSGEVEVALE